MKLTDIFIKRPVFATVLSLVILLLGAMSYMKLTVRQYPKIDTSVVTINTSYPGASAKLMEGFVTTPLESSIAGVEGIDYMTSQSSSGSSSITVQLKLGYPIDKAISDISDKVSSVRWELPKEINDPVIAKQDPNANPTMFIGFASEAMNAEAITDYLTRVVQPQLETLPGVGEAKILGGREYAMRIWLNPNEMAAHSVTANDVQAALEKNNVQSAAGRIEGKMQEMDVLAKTDLNTAKAFNNLVIKDVNGQLIRLKDIGRAELGPANTRSSFFMNGKRATVIGIIPKSTANPLDVAKEVNKELKVLNQRMPNDLNANVIWDSSRFISESISEVFRTIFEATLLVILVIFLFLGSMRATIIPIITIPLSLIGTGFIMLMLGFTINTLTLLAMVLAIGMVVDDAIVVAENIHRHIEMGKTKFQAAIEGAREIRFAVIAMTFTLAAVYAPIGFMGGLTGKLFREFAFALAGAVIISGFCALTLSPMMCSKILSNKQSEKSLATRIDHLFSHFLSGYQWLISKVLKWRVLIIVAALLVYGSCYLLYKITPEELAPAEDQGGFMALAIGPSTANLQYMEKYTKEIAGIFQKVPELQAYGIINGFPRGINSGIAFMTVKPWSERKRSTLQIIQSLAPQLWGIPGVMAFAVNPPSLPGSSSFSPFSFVIKTTGSYEELNALMDKLMAAAYQYPGFMNIQKDIYLDKPEVTVDINRNKAGEMGIPMSAIGSNLNIFLGQPTSSRFAMSGRSYKVIPQLYPRFQRNPHELNNLYVHSNSGALVPLSNLVTIKQSIGPRSLNHFQQLRSATLSASVTPGFTMGQDLQYMENVANQILPKNVSYGFASELRQFVEASGQMAEIFLFALIFIYLILAAQFESFRDPFIVMLSVPLSTAGALLTLFLTKGTLNIYTEIGLVTLIGLISKHGILIVEFANQLQDKGRSIKEAVIEAAGLRLRPILMTTGAMILGAMPLALASGAGAAARRQLGWTIVGGMSFGTILTLFVVPVAYTYLARKRAKINQEQ